MAANKQLYVLIIESDLEKFELLDALKSRLTSLEDTTEITNIATEAEFFA